MMSEMAVVNDDVLKTIAAQLANSKKWQDRFEQAEVLLKQEAEQLLAQKRDAKGKRRLSQYIRVKHVAAQFAQMSVNLQCGLAHIQEAADLLDSVIGRGDATNDTDERQT
jgi:hypothetical protein